MSTPRPPHLRIYPLFERVSDHLPLFNRGKIRDSFTLTIKQELGRGKILEQEALLLIATDGLSCYDFVLNCQVPGKGTLLNALTVYWHSLFGLAFDTHLFAWGEDIDRYLPSELRGDVELHRQGLIVWRYELAPIEAIVRGYLTGSGYKAYQRDGTVCGIELPSGLHDGSRLLMPIFTPTTKAESGHDEHIDRDSVRQDFPEIEGVALSVYAQAAEHALDRGVIIADTKFEMTVDGVVCDEILTPDSSRFWDYEEWLEATRGDNPHSPTAYDKQVARDWCAQVETPFCNANLDPIVGINSLDPENPDHLNWVHELEIPEEVVDQVAERYAIIFDRLTDGQRAEDILGITT